MESSVLRVGKISGEIFIYMYFGKNKESIKKKVKKKKRERDFPGIAMVGNLSGNAGHMGLIPGPGRSHITQSN